MLSNIRFNYLANFWRTGVVAIAASTLPLLPLYSQTPIPLDDLSAFRSPPQSWKVVGEAGADLQKPLDLHTSPGTGVLANLPDKKNKGADLYTNFEHADIDLELEYMMAPGSNSGIYLQGLYELQLADSWGVQQPTSAANGGVYERWDDSRPQGQQGYQGYAPRQNVSKAPGLWQHLKIAYQAPRFDASGQKTENAKLLRVSLNGVLIHENVELLGPTRGAMQAKELPKGPLRLQGDHGPVAFRNMVVTHYDKARPRLSDLRYTVYEGRFDDAPNYDSLPPEAEGNSVVLTSNISPLPKQFLIRYQGTLNIEEPGEYRFNLNVPGGRGYLKIGDGFAIPLTGWGGQAKITLPAGNMPFELVYSKFMDWVTPALGLAVAGPGVREYMISDEIASRGEPVDPILVGAPENTVLRSFMDIPGEQVPGRSPEKGYRVTHAVNVGSPQQVHYTYDMDHGALIQAWRGGFLDTTPMWHDRGDGSSRPVGAILPLAAPQLSVARLATETAPWVSDTLGSYYRPKGYVLDATGLPAFQYKAWGAVLEDAVKPLPDGKGLRRELKVQNSGQGLYMRLAEGSSISSVGKGLYLVDGKAYYLKLEDTSGAKPLLRSTTKGQELVVPLRDKLVYNIIF